MDGTKPRKIGLWLNVRDCIFGPRQEEPPRNGRCGYVSSVALREMTPAHVNGVVEIERTSFPTPWSRQAFLSEVTENGMARYIVAEAEGTVVAYGGMWVVFDEAHVTNIAVAPRWRRRGIGTLILKGLIERARAAGATRMSLEVRVSNYPARTLYEKFGFEKRGIRRGYYADTCEDAIVMWLDDLGRNAGSD